MPDKLTPDRSAFVVLAASTLIVALLVVRRWGQMGPYPTGLDGGQWLALGRGLFGQGRSTDGAYAPLVPVLTSMAATVWGPMTGLKVVALGALVVAILGAVLLARCRLDRGWTLVLAVLVVAGTASALTEPLGYGGYPQLFALGGMLGGVATYASAVTGEQRRLLPLAALLLLSAALAHHVYGPLSVICTLLVLLVSVRPRQDALRRRLKPGLVALAPAALGSVATLSAFLRSGYSPPLDAAELGRLSAFAYATREATPFWAAVVTLGVLALVTRPDLRDPGWLATASIVVVPGTLFLAAPEPRLLPPVLIGSLVAALRLVRDAASRAPDRLGPALALLLALGVARLALGGDEAAERYFAYYRVADGSLIAGATIVQENAGQGVVAVRASRRGWPVGWWYEGLTTARIAVGSDPRWLGFPQERDQAALASRFFGPGLTGEQLRALAAETGVRMLVCDPEEWIGWQRWLAEPNPPVTVEFDDGQTLVMRIEVPAP